MHKKFLIINKNKLICTVHVPKNMKIFPLEGRLLCYSTPNTIHIGNDVHILDDYGRFMTHSFQPTCKIDGFNVIAMKNIIPGDILTYNFNKTELHMSNPFVQDGIIVCGQNNHLHDKS